MHVAFLTQRFSSWHSSISVLAGKKKHWKAKGNYFSIHMYMKQSHCCLNVSTNNHFSMVTRSADSHLTRAQDTVTLMKFFHSSGGNKTIITDARIAWGRVETGCIMSTQSWALKTLVDIFVKKTRVKDRTFVFFHSKRDVYAASLTITHSRRISRKISRVCWWQETIQTLAVKAATCVHTFCIRSTDPSLIIMVFTAFTFIVVFMKYTKMDKSESNRVSL